MRILVGVAPRAAKRALARQLNRERGSPTGQNVGPGLQNFRNSQQRLPLAWKLNRGGQQQMFDATQEEKAEISSTICFESIELPDQKCRPAPSGTVADG